MVQIHILWLLEDGCSCRVWCVVSFREQQLLRNSRLCMFFPPKYLHGSVWCWYITVGIAMKQPYIILYIWLYVILYIYTVQDWLGFWIFPWYVSLVIRTRNRTTSRTYYSWKLLLLGPGFNFKISHQTVPVCEMMFGGQIDILVGIFPNLSYYSQLLATDLQWCLQFDLYHAPRVLLQIFAIHDICVCFLLIHSHWLHQFATITFVVA